MRKPGIVCGVASISLCSKPTGSALRSASGTDRNSLRSGFPMKCGFYNSPCPASPAYWSSECSSRFDPVRIAPKMVKYVNVIGPFRLPRGFSHQIASKIRLVRSILPQSRSLLSVMPLEMVAPCPIAAARSLAFPCRAGWRASQQCWYLHPQCSAYCCDESGDQYWFSEAYCAEFW